MLQSRTSWPGMRSGWWTWVLCWKHTSSRKIWIALSLGIFQSWLRPSRGLLGRYFQRTLWAHQQLYQSDCHRWKHFSWWRFGGQDHGAQNEQKLHEVHEPQLPLDSQTKISSLWYWYLCRWSMVVQSARIACFRGNSILFPSSGVSKFFKHNMIANTLQNPTNQKPCRNTYKSYMPTTHSYPTSTQHYIPTLPLHTCTAITTYTTLQPLQYNTSYNLRYTVALPLHTCSMSMRLAREAAIC